MDGFYVGDIVEKYNLKTKNFELFTNRSKFSDDTILSFATIDWLINSNHTGQEMLSIINKFYAKYPDKTPTIYGPTFAAWAKNGCKTYRQSYGNGGAMRCSPIAWYAKSVEEIDDLIEKGISPTHNTKNGKLGAKIVCFAIFYLRQNISLNELKSTLIKQFNIDLNENIDKYRQKYEYTSDAVETVRPALISLLNSTNYEDAIRNAVSFGGDTDTITKICSAMAEAYYKTIPENIKQKAKTFLPQEFVNLLNKFNKEITNEKV